MYRPRRSHFPTDSPKLGCTGSLCRSSALVMFRQVFSMPMWSDRSYVEIERCSGAIAVQSRNEG